MKTQTPKLSKVDRVIAVDQASSDYQIKLTPEETKEFLQRAEIYNRIPKTIALIVDQIDAITPRAYYNPDNPNNGSQIFNFRVGNEGSRVLYLEVRAPFGLPKDFDWLEYERKLTEIGKTFDADEIDTLENKPAYKLTIRFWWD